MTITRFLLVALAAVAALVLAACGEEAPGATPDDTDDTGDTGDTDHPDGLDGSWQLVDGTGPGGAVPLVETHPVSLVFEDGGTLGGTAACNSYGGQYELDGDRLTVREIFQTEMACIPDEVMESERAYLTALSAVEEVTRDGDRLVLAGPDVRLEFEQLPETVDAALEGTNWILDTVVQGEAATQVPELDRPATLEFAADGRFQGFTGCNDVGGRYEVDNGRLTFSAVDVTDADCNDLADLQEHLLAVLDGEVEAEISGDRLNLTGPGGLGLSYRAGP